jgi:hypothetical protein
MYWRSAGLKPNQKKKENNAAKSDEINFET